MELLYKGLKQNNILTKALVFNNFLYSEKKEKYYCKIELKDYLVIGFKNNYCLLFERVSKKIKRDTAKIRDFYYRIVNGEIIKCTEK